jgi:CBS domain-containing protein
MTTMQQLLDQKGRKIWSIHQDATVFDAIAKMAEKNIGSLVVMDGEKLVGIITERLCVPKIRFCNIGGEGRRERVVM